MAGSLAPISVAVTRGHGDTYLEESSHQVHAVVCDGDGQVMRTYGDADFPTFPRSAIKLLQALPLVETGAADKYGLGPEHLALACASHNGESFHVAAAEWMLKQAGLKPVCLECGAQLPYHPHDVAEVLREGGATALHNNCSGKHAGFLCVAAHEGVETKGYVKFGHPVQDMIAGVLTDTTGAAHGEDNYGIDGCSIPTWRIPLKNLASAYGKVASGSGFGRERDKAAVRLRDACMVEPAMVAGTGRFCTEIMTGMNSDKGRVFVKTGAEGVFTACLPELGIGFALKCTDGTGRAAEAACAALVETLLQEARSPLSEKESKLLTRLKESELRNRNNILVGHVTARLPK